MPWTPAPGGGSAFPDYDQTATPTSPSAGEFWWDRSVHVLKRYNGTSWDWIGLDDLANVNTAGKADTSILEWDTDGDPDAWIDTAKPSGGGGAFSGGKATRSSTSQNIANTTEVAIQFDTEAHDVDGWVDLATNNTRVTAPAADKVTVKAGLSWAGNNTGVRVLHLRKNGTTNIASDVRAVPGALAPTIQCVAVDDDAAAGDYYELIGYQSSGGTLAAGGAVNTFLSAAVL